MNKSHPIPDNPREIKTRSHPHAALKTTPDLRFVCSRCDKVIMLLWCCCAIVGGEGGGETTNARSHSYHKYGLWLIFIACCWVYFLVPRKVFSFVRERFAFFKNKSKPNKVSENFGCE